MADAGFDWASAGRPIPGERQSGDLGLVCHRPDHTVLAVIDGLGHGAKAAHAAGCARAVLEERPETSLERLMVLCHRALAGTRGAAMAVAVVHHPTATMEWLAIGNVEAAIVRRGHPSSDREMVFHVAGVVGHQLPMFRVPTATLSPGDTLVFATDGIAASFLAELEGLDRVGASARRILERHARPEDDALVLLARYTGLQTTS